MNKIIPENKTKESYVVNSLSYDVGLLLTLSIALVVRLPYLFTESMGSDEALYAWNARLVAAGVSYIFSGELLEFHPPLFPVFLSLFQAVVPAQLQHTEVGYRIFSLFVSLAGISAIYWLGIKISGRFLGLFCAILLTFNYLYFLQGTQILIDVPLTFFCIVLLIILMDGKHKYSRKRDIFVGLLSSVIFLLKWSGIALLPFLVIYYIFSSAPIPLHLKLKKLAIPVAIISGTMILYSFIKFIQCESFLLDIHELTTKRLDTKPGWYYFANLHNIVMVPAVLPLFFYGVYRLLKDNHPQKTLLIGYFVVLWGMLHFPTVKNLRYTIILLPAMLMIAGIGLEGSLQQFLQKNSQLRIGKFLTLFLVYLLCWQLHPRTEILLQKSLATSTGLAEAGQWLSRNTDPETTMIAQNARPTRYYSGMNYKKYGGPILVLPYKRSEFEDMIKLINGRILLQVEIWSSYHPFGFVPFENDAFFQSLGFRLVKQIKRPVYTNDSLDKRTIPVVKIFERP